MFLRQRETTSRTVPRELAISWWLSLTIPSLAARRIRKLANRSDNEKAASSSIEVIKSNTREETALNVKFQMAASFSYNALKFVGGMTSTWVTGPSDSTQ